MIRKIAIAGLVFAVVVGRATAGDQRVVDAARTGDVAAVRTLLRHGAAPDARQGDGATALHWASHQDNLELADLLLKAGANANAANDLGVTPLWLASVNASAPMVGRLLRAGAKANVSLPSGETALMTAARAGNPEVVRLLIGSGADVNAREHAREQTALMWAVAQRHPEVVKTLIETGADVHARSAIRHRRVNTETSGFGKEILAEVDFGGYTSLLFAARVGDIESARLLLAGGASVNEIAPEGTSALVIAIHSGHAVLGRFLLEQGADPNAAEAGYTALHAAILHGEVDLVKALLARGADPNARLVRGTPARRSSPDYVISGEYVGADPIWLAARFGEPAIMRVLATNGARRAPGVRGGATVLMSAVQATRRTEPGIIVDIAERERIILDTVTVALDLGDDINATDQDGNTALHLAASRRQDAVIRLLVTRGARFDIRNKKNATPLALAANSKTTAELLRQLGAKE